MPICPGCERQVPYNRLDVHERHCDGIRSDFGVGSRSVERLEYRVADMERRLEGRLRDIESEFERRMKKLERTGRV